MYKARFDGACQPNPSGKASCACIVMDGAEEVYRASSYLGEGRGMTNNVAEYQGVIMLLRWLLAQPGPVRMLIRGDSRIVINRLNKKNPVAPVGVSSELAKDARYLSIQVGLRGHKVSYKWEPRGANGLCDGMAKMEIEKATGIQVVNPAKEKSA